MALLIDAVAMRFRCRCRDWQLKQEFWQHIIAVCAFIGKENVRNLVLPLLEFHNAAVSAVVVGEMASEAASPSSLAYCRSTCDCWR